MRPRDLLRFALGALAGHRLRTALSLVGVAIGVTAVVVLTALGDGARRYVTDQFRNIGTNLLIVIPGRTDTTGGMPGMGGVPHDLTLADADALARELPAVERTAPVAMGTETVAHGERRRQMAVVGTTADLLPVRRLRLRQGAFLPPGDAGRGAPVVVLGATAARELFPEGDPLGRVVRLGSWRMRVIGVLAPRGVQLGMDMDDLVIVPVTTAMRLFNRASLFRIFVQVRGRDSVDAAKPQVVGLLAARHREEDVTCIAQDAVVQTFGSILQALTLALFAVAAISLSVAGIGIMNVMLVSVSERTAEVGLLRALGAARRQILAAFLLEAVLLSTAGGLAGLLAGWAAVAALVAVYPDLPASPPAWAVAAALVLSAAVGAGFGVLPARRATRLDPVSALARR